MSFAESQTVTPRDLFRHYAVVETKPVRTNIAETPTHFVVAMNGKDSETKPDIMLLDKERFFEGAYQILQNIDVKQATDNALILNDPNMKNKLQKLFDYASA